MDMTSEGHDIWSALGYKLTSKLLTIQKHGYDFWQCMLWVEHLDISWIKACVMSYRGMDMASDGHAKFRLLDISWKHVSKLHEHGYDSCLAVSIRRWQWDEGSMIGCPSDFHKPALITPSMVSTDSCYHLMGILRLLNSLLQFGLSSSVDDPL